MDVYVHERGQAAETQRLFSERGGFCREHAWLFHRRSALALTGAPVAQMYEGLLSRDIARLERLAQQLPDKQAAVARSARCSTGETVRPANAPSNGSTTRPAAFVAALREPDVQAAYEPRTGCASSISTLSGRRRSAGDSHVAGFLIGDLKRRLEQLKTRLDEYERKRDYRFAAARTDADSAAWTDVVRSYVGDQFLDGDM